MVQSTAFIEDNRAIQSSVWTIRLALFSTAIVVLTALFHRLFGMPTAVALNLFALSFIGCGLALLIGLFALVRIWQRGWAGGSNAVTGMVISVLLLAWPMGVLVKAGDYPRINDVATDLADPPLFVFAAEKRPPGSHDTVYRQEFATVQKESYPDLRTLRVQRSPEAVMELVRKALQRKRMILQGEIPFGTGGRDFGQLEAVDRTLVLGFYDDVVVRVRAVRGGSAVDIRSASRFGESDFGANAGRIRDLRTEIVARVEASVPAGARARRQRSRRQGTSQ